MASEVDLIGLFKDFVWVPGVALVAWAWNHNEKEHDRMREAHSKLFEETAKGHSTLNEKILEHVDERIDEVRADQEKKMDRLTTHITKLFENSEKDRAQFRDALQDHAKDSNERHIEILKSQQEILVALHTGLATKADK